MPSTEDDIRPVGYNIHLRKESSLKPDSTMT